jgi:hypothetical protein
MALLTFLVPFVVSVSHALEKLDGPQQFGVTVMSYAHDAIVTVYATDNNDSPHPRY